jgi:hypothetical protein
MRARELKMFRPKLSIVRDYIVQNPWPRCAHRAPILDFSKERKWTGKLTRTCVWRVNCQVLMKFSVFSDLCAFRPMSLYQIIKNGERRRKVKFSYCWQWDCACWQPPLTRIKIQSVSQSGQSAGAIHMDKPNFSNLFNCSLQSTKRPLWRKISRKPLGSLKAHVISKLRERAEWEERRSYMLHVTYYWLFVS